MNATKIRVLNVDIDNITMDTLLERKEGVIMTVHPDMLMRLQKDREFYDVANKADLITCDSQILMFISKLMGTPFVQRVSGSDYFPLFYKKFADDPSVTIFLLGAMEGVGATARDKINAKVGRDIVVGVYSPPFGFSGNPEELDKVIDQVNASGATVVVTGFTASISEKLYTLHRDRFINAKLFLSLGGTIDYEAGQVKRPAPWVTNIGLEWAWRVMLEPRKRWKRYFIEQPPVLVLLAKQRFGRYHNPFA